MNNPRKPQRPESRKRSYSKPEIKKREQLKEITQSPAPAVTGGGGGGGGGGD